MRLDPESTLDPEEFVGSLEWDPHESPLLDDTVKDFNITPRILRNVFFAEFYGQMNSSSFSLWLEYL